ncbi:MAG: PAS domain S-box protein [Bacteroidetes bacterium]|nr:PAS domain S-box protein [Bacteroidota bacterium]
MKLPNDIYKNIFNEWRDYTFLLNADGEVVDMNDRAKQKVALHATLKDLFSLEGKLQFEEALQQRSSTFRSDFFFSPDDHCFASVTVLQVPTDKTRFDLVVVQDITVQHDKELELLRFSEVIHRTVNPIQITNTEGKMIYVNPAFEHITGYSRHELIGANPNILSSGKHGKEFWKKVWVKIYAGEQWVGQLQNRRKNGELFHTELVISPIVDEQKKVIGFLGAHRDITDQKILERQVVRSQKMETFGTLAAGIAHEVGNPLTSISSLVQVVQMQSSDEFVHEKLELVKNQINRIAKILRELVDFSRPSSHEVKDVSVNLVLREAINIVQYGKKTRTIRFNVALEENLPFVHAVHDQLLQVFLNILMNAVDASMGISDPAIAILTKQSDEKVEISITDNGTGIAEKNIGKIFDPFFTTKEVGKGTGLGLWVSLGIIRNFGGDIQVESEEGKSTTFVVRLPIKGM